MSDYLKPATQSSPATVDQVTADKPLYWADSLTATIAYSYRPCIVKFAAIRENNGLGGVPDGFHYDLQFQIVDCETATPYSTMYSITTSLDTTGLVYVGKGALLPHSTDLPARPLGILMFHIGGLHETALAPFAKLAADADKATKLMSKWPYGAGMSVTKFAQYAEAILRVRNDPAFTQLSGALQAVIVGLV